MALNFFYCFLLLGKYISIFSSGDFVTNLGKMVSSRFSIFDYYFYISLIFNFDFSDTKMLSLNTSGDFSSGIVFNFSLWSLLAGDGLNSSSTFFMLSKPSWASSASLWLYVINGNFCYMCFFLPLFSFTGVTESKYGKLMFRARLYFIDFLLLALMKTWFSESAPSFTENSDIRLDKDFRLS